MQAHLQRARIFQRQGRAAERRPDLDAVISSPVNFAGTVAEALVLCGKIRSSADDDKGALNDFSSALSQTDADGSVIAEAYVGAAISLLAMDQDEEAKIALNAASEHPEASDFVRTQATDILSSLASD